MASLFLPLLLLLLAVADALPPSCSEVVFCAGHVVQYPFWLINSSTSDCGYPGLGLVCEDNATLILPVKSHHYRVFHIDYDTHTVAVSDADIDGSAAGCPRLHVNLTIDTASSWLRLTPSDSNVTFLYDCKKNASSLSSAVELSWCPGGGGGRRWYVLLPDGGTGAEAREYECEEVVVALVLGVHKEGMVGPPGAPAVGDMVRAGFQLMYNAHSVQCHGCERSGGWCGYRHNQTDGGAMNFTCFCDGGPTADRCGGSKAQKGVIIGVSTAAGLAVLAAAAAAGLFIMCKRKKKNVINSSSKLLKYSGSGGTPRARVGDMESGCIEDPPTHLFTYEELEEATNSFDEHRELGDGGFGTVYKGYLKDGRVVAVKRLYNNSYRRVEQFQNEAGILSGLRHPNLVMFYGCTPCSSRELLLVYEFVANGTVADHLHGHRAPERALSWPLRLSIAVESAAALSYLHAIEPPVVHRDVKTTNILLDADFHVKVADFGLSRLFPLDVTHVSTAPQGTPGYVDPEYHQCYQLTDKSDVYSFGVVLVELISSKPAVDITRHRNEINLAGMAISKIQNCHLEQLVDLDLGYEADPATKKMMTMVAELAFRCLQQNGEMRPPMKEVLEVLRSVQGECPAEKDGDKHKDGPFSPTTVHAPWDSRATTPNTSRD
ncbi:LEAF RUST 10 DISEASE-RESISTANCE LOCUS RECEPTOR-LIKE PROTEIN KINASE-like 1.2 isoform X4 [Panicum virgatum]|uniref:LEAF RUST 10 DISEASE-RESISTANCE LOCUS RECEPTOR-LIKE PROTEIN KINASE-like 1.2 isoform X4 n=1 Tax=Panicum virgatum TaxID=38727 RepID=UPI0019D502EE|nr:LEAF RUST 10 DISEASE-RESISTANCE LOCUS RECEPTOR-LIKE PROTEIN KINASE-like 1.2 isoform X4 [Panicum virgatum]